MHTIFTFFEYLAKSNTINFLLMVGLLVWICRKIDIKSSLESAVDKVKNEISSSEKAKNDAHAYLSNCEDDINKLPLEIEKLNEEIEQKSKISKENIELNKCKAISKIEESFDEVVNAEEKIISAELLEDAINVSVEQAKIKIMNQLSSNPDLHKKFIEDSLNNLMEASL